MERAGRASTYTAGYVTGEELDGYSIIFRTMATMMPIDKGAAAEANSVKYQLVSRKRPRETPNKTLEALIVKRAAV